MPTTYVKLKTPRNPRERVLIGAASPCGFDTLWVIRWMPGKHKRYVAKKDVVEIPTLNETLKHQQPKTKIT